MAAALKCDRCKKLYEESTTDKRIVLGTEQVVCIRVYRDFARKAGNELDICDGCLDELVPKWLETY